MLPETACYFLLTLQIDLKNNSKIIAKSENLRDFLCAFIVE